MDDFMEQIVDRMVRAKYDAMEMAARSGCDYCGKQVVQDDKPLPGGTFLEFPDQVVKVCCGDCYERKAWLG